MSLPFIADENVDARMVHRLRLAGWDVTQISGNHIGIADLAVAAVARSEGRVLITRDKDFGELMNDDQLTGLSVLFLRYPSLDWEAMTEQILTLLDQAPILGQGEFVTLTPNKIRRRLI